MHKLDMQFGETIPTDPTLEIDPLGEFTCFERGFFTHCRDNNCWIHIKIASQDMAIQLFRDLSPHLLYLPEAISNSADRSKLTIELPEIGTSLRLEWTPSSCFCLLDSMTAIVDRDQAIIAIGSLLETLISQAASTRHVEQVDADEFLETLKSGIKQVLAK
jgi:hypothetical protein